MVKSTKKRIAVYTNGWNNQITLQALSGIKAYAKEEDFDIYVFCGHATYDDQDTDTLNAGEIRIYELADVSDFDGLIVFSAFLNSKSSVMDIVARAKKAGVPMVSVGVPLEGVPFVGINNETGMKALMTKLIEECGVKRVVFMGGTPDHVDSIERLRVVEEVLEAHGLSLAPEDICYGDWGNIRPRFLMDDVILKRGLPDAVVCANDIMALAVMSICVERGIKVPDEVKITGFDCIYDGQIFYPSLTTVTQDYHEVGMAAAKQVCDIIHGRETDWNVMVPSKLVAAESGGGTPDRDYEEVRRQFCQGTYGKYLMSNRLDESERMLRTRISESEDYFDLKANMRTHYSRNSSFEGKDFAMVIDSEYIRDVMKEESELTIDTYEEEMDVIVYRLDGVVGKEDNLVINRHQLVPNYEKKPGVQNVFYFLPLHTFQYNYGYMMFSLDGMVIQEEDRVYNYMEKAQQALKLLRVNLRLDAMNQNLIRLYDKDPMTDLYNRFAYEDKAIPLIEAARRDKTTAMVLFVDINYMKRINDKYGHIHGDNAIRTVATAIKQNIEENWIAVRYGGDEFLVIAPNCGKERAEQTKQHILKYLEDRNHDQNQPYRISASSGYVITDPESEMSLEDYIKEADKLMYEMKAIVHANDPR